MIANLAEFRNTHRRSARVQVPVSGQPCNDNQPLRLVAAAPRRSKPILVSRWHLTASGTLECAWESASTNTQGEGA